MLILRLNELSIDYVNSALCKSVDSEEETITVPNTEYYPKEIIGNDDDLKLALKAMMYWGFDEIPTMILKYVFYTGAIHIFDEISNLNKSTYYEQLIIISTGDISLTASKGLLYIMKFLIDEDIKRREADISFSVHLDRLFWAHKSGCEMEYLSYMISKMNVYKNEHLSNRDICENAAKNGHLDCLIYAHEHGYPWRSSICDIIAKNGHLDCLKYVHSQKCPWDKITCESAAFGGHLDCLQYLHEKGCPWDEYTCSEAANNGYLDCLKYAHENLCPWNGDTCLYAAKHGHLECLKYLHENVCPWDEFMCSVTAECGHLHCLKYAS